jgi:hypothetical protein
MPAWESGEGLQKNSPCLLSSLNVPDRLGDFMVPSEFPRVSPICPQFPRSGDHTGTIGEQTSVRRIISKQESEFRELETLCFAEHRAAQIETCEEGVLAETKNKAEGRVSK